MADDNNETQEDVKETLEQVVAREPRLSDIMDPAFKAGFIVTKIEYREPTKPDGFNELVRDIRSGKVHGDGIKERLQEASFSVDVRFTNTIDSMTLLMAVMRDDEEEN